MARHGPASRGSTRSLGGPEACRMRRARPAAPPRVTPVAQAASKLRSEPTRLFFWPPGWARAGWRCKACCASSSPRRATYHTPPPPRRPCRPYAPRLTGRSLSARLQTITLALSFSSMVEYYVLKAMLPALTPLVARRFRAQTPRPAQTRALSSAAHARSAPPRRASGRRTRSSSCGCPPPSAPRPRLSSCCSPGRCAAAALPTRPPHPDLLYPRAATFPLVGRRAGGSTVDATAGSAGGSEAAASELLWSSGGLWP